MAARFPFNFDFGLALLRSQGDGVDEPSQSPSGIRAAKRDVDLVAERLKTAESDYEEHYGKPKR